MKLFLVKINNLLVGTESRLVYEAEILTEIAVKNAEPGVSELAPRAAWFSERGRSGLCF